MTLNPFRRWLDNLQKRRRNQRRSQPRPRVRLHLEELEPRIVPDSTGARVLDIVPVEFRNLPFDHVDVRFSETINATTFTAVDVQITSPSGSTIAASGVTPLTADTFRIAIQSPTERGTYRVQLGANIEDVDGNLMDQNQNGVNGEATGKSPSRIACCCV